MRSSVDFSNGYPTLLRGRAAVNSYKAVVRAARHFSPQPQPCLQTRVASPCAVSPVSVAAEQAPSQFRSARASFPLTSRSRSPVRQDNCGSSTPCPAVSCTALKPQFYVQTRATSPCLVSSARVAPSAQREQLPLARVLSPVRQENCGSSTPCHAISCSAGRSQLCLQRLGERPLAVTPILVATAQPATSVQTGQLPLAYPSPVLTSRSCSPPQPIRFRSVSPFQGVLSQHSHATFGSKGNSCNVAPANASCSPTTFSVDAPYLPHGGALPVPLPLQQRRATPMPLPLQQTEERKSYQCNPSLLPVTATVAQSNGTAPVNSPAPDHRSTTVSVSSSPVIARRGHDVPEQMKSAALGVPPRAAQPSMPVSGPSEMQHTKATPGLISTTCIEQQSLLVARMNEMLNSFATVPSASTCARTCSRGARTHVTPDNLKNRELTFDVDSAEPPTERGRGRQERSAKFQSWSSGDSVLSPCAADRAHRPVSYKMTADGQLVKLGDGPDAEVA